MKNENLLSIDIQCILMGYNDRARDRANTKYLLSKGADLGTTLNTIDKESGLEEIHKYLKNIMAGKQMYVLFSALGRPIQNFLYPAFR